MTLNINTENIDIALANGDIELYEKISGMHFEYNQKVVHGDKRGRKIGFPTINQYLPENLIKPKYGVYATIVTIDDKKYYGITNIGIRPTFSITTPNSETYVIGFNGNLYDKSIKVRLVKYLRPERKFDSLEDLQKQLEEDKKKALNILDNK